MNIQDKIEHFIAQHRLIASDQKIIIGLSGGPDSVFLLYTLVQLQKKYNLILIAAHLNHEWRPESLQEELLCRSLAEQNNVLFISRKLSELSLDKAYNGSKEEYARNMRRHFFEKVLQEQGAHHIALGHHAQDQQETFFIRLVRGTSLTGLTGIHPKNGHYIRPLLETNKNDILTWLNERNICYALDATNDSQQFLRNRIRSVVLPALRECDTRFETNFLATLHRLKMTEMFLEKLTEKTFDEISSIDNRILTIHIPLFLNTDEALQHRIIMRWLITENVQFPPTQAFLDEIIRFLKSPHGGVHTIHTQWSLIKKQKSASIVLNTSMK